MVTDKDSRKQVERNDERSRKGSEINRKSVAINNDISVFLLRLIDFLRLNFAGIRFLINTCSLSIACSLLCEKTFGKVFI